MKLIIFTHPTFSASQSMPRYAEWLAKGMRERQHTVEVKSPRPIFYKLNLPKKIKKWLGYIDQYILFPIQIKRELSKSTPNTLYVFTDHALGPWVPLVQNKQHIIHCHDFLAQKSAMGLIPQNPTGLSGRIYQRYIRNGFKKGRNFISISNKTKDDLEAFLGKNPDLSERVYNGLNRKFNAVSDLLNLRIVLSEELNLPLQNGYLLHVGGNQWYKNRVGVIRIYEAWRMQNTLKIPLIMVGASPNKTLKEAKESSIYASEIFFLANLDDHKLRRIYSGASVFLFPSVAEGFGWPIAEAMASGVPVLTTNAAPMNEVGGGACFYIDVMPIENQREWAQKAAAQLEIMLQLTPSKREQVIQRGFRQVENFDSELALNKIEGIYKRILES